MRFCALFLTLGAIFLWLTPCNPAEASPARGIAAFHQEETTAGSAETETQDPGMEEILSGPQDIRERIAIAVFLGWMWLSILVLIYILSLKIKESDRLNNFAYFDKDEEAPKQGI